MLEEMVLPAVFDDEPQMWLEEGRVYVLWEMVLPVVDYEPQILAYSEFSTLDRSDFLINHNPLDPVAYTLPLLGLVEQTRWHEMRLLQRQ